MAVLTFSGYKWTGKHIDKLTIVEEEIPERELSNPQIAVATDPGTREYPNENDFTNFIHWFFNISIYFFLLENTRVKTRKLWKRNTTLQQLVFFSNLLNSLLILFWSVYAAQLLCLMLIAHMYV